MKARVSFAAFSLTLLCCSPVWAVAEQGKVADQKNIKGSAGRVSAPAQSAASSAKGKLSATQRASRPPSVPSPGVALPKAATYRLPIIQPAGNGWVLDGNQFPRRLSQYTKGAITLLSFVYTYCADPDGCPLAYATMQELKRRILADASLHGRVRFVSLSFDPEHDTPQMMQAYGRVQTPSPALPWSFLTTYSPRFLQPILDDYGQAIEAEKRADGVPSRVIAHLLKVFLIDERANIREIYSTAYMNPELIYNDIKTIALESPKSR